MAATKPIVTKPRTLLSGPARSSPLLLPPPPPPPRGDNPPWAPQPIKKGNRSPGGVGPHSILRSSMAPSGAWVFEILRTRCPCFLAGPGSPHPQPAPAVPLRLHFPTPGAVSHGIPTAQLPPGSDAMAWGKPGLLPTSHFRGTHSPTQSLSLQGLQGCPLTSTSHRDMSQNSIFKVNPLSHM